MLKLNKNIVVCFSVSESQVTAPGTGVSIYSDLSTNSMETGTEPGNGKATGRDVIENNHLGLTPLNLYKLRHLSKIQ